MKTLKNIFIAFILNLSFAIVELFGGFFTGSIAILSDAVHDFGDSLSIGVSFFLEKKSKNKPNKNYTYGYARYSVIGSLFTTLVLLIGSGFIIYESICRIITPSEIKSDKMIIFAIVGFVVNFLAAYFTHGGKSVNQRAVNLHMLEDVLGWIVVLLGSIIIRFTGFILIDPIMSIAIAFFILVATLINLFKTLELFLEKTPDGISIDHIEEHLLQIEGVEGVHHIHVWTLDGTNNYCTLHVVTNADSHLIKEMVKKELKEHSIAHSTVEIESVGEDCEEKECSIKECCTNCHHHH